MRAARTLSILMLLQRRGRLSATELAGLLEVSVRTVHRDIEHLSAAGVPVYAIRGRDGGFELLDGWRTELTGLTGDEAEAMFLAGVPGLAHRLGLGRQLDAAELKLLAALTGDDPHRVRDRFHVDPTRWFADDEATPLLPVLSAATWRDERIRITYESWTRTSTRVVSPLGIVVKAGLWYLVAIATTRPHTYRVSQVQAVEPTGQHFERPANFDLAGYWARHTNDYERSRYTSTAVIRASPAGIARLARSSRIVADAINEAAAAATRSTDEDGWVLVTIPIESFEHAVADLLSTDIEVVAPAELRAQLRAASQSVAARHRQRRRGDRSRPRPPS